MPILQITDATSPTLLQQCTECANTSSIPCASLVLGVVQDKIPDPNMIALPPCKCGAQEFLNQTFDVGPDNMSGHRKKVNALAIDLKAKGQVHPELADRIKADTSVPAQVGELLGPVLVQAGLPAPKLAEGVKLVAALRSAKASPNHAVEVLKRVQKEPRKKASTDNPKRTEFLKAQSAIITAVAAVRRKPLAPNAFAAPKAIPAPAQPAAFVAMPDTAAPVVAAAGATTAAADAPAKGGGKKGKNA